MPSLKPAEPSLAGGVLRWQEASKAGSKTAAMSGYQTPDPMQDGSYAGRGSIISSLLPRRRLKLQEF